MVVMMVLMMVVWDGESRKWAGDWWAGAGETTPRMNGWTCGLGRYKNAKEREICKILDFWWFLGAGDVEYDVFGQTQHGDLSSDWIFRQPLFFLNMDFWMKPTNNKAWSFLVGRNQSWEYLLQTSFDFLKSIFINTTSGLNNSHLIMGIIDWSGEVGL